MMNQSQANDLAHHFVEILSSLTEYFQDPDNKRAYQKWYQEKYGCEPKTEDEV